MTGWRGSTPCFSTSWQQVEVNPGSPSRHGASCHAACDACFSHFRPSTHISMLIVKHYYFVGPDSVPKPVLVLEDGAPCHPAHWRRVCVGCCGGAGIIYRICALFPDHTILCSLLLRVGIWFRSSPHEQYCFSGVDLAINASSYGSNISPTSSNDIREQFIFTLFVFRNPIRRSIMAMAAACPCMFRFFLRLNLGHSPRDPKNY